MKTMNDNMEHYGMNRDEFIRQQQENMRWMRRCILVMMVTVAGFGMVATLSILASCIR